MVSLSALYGDGAKLTITDATPEFNVKVNGQTPSGFTVSGVGTLVPGTIITYELTVTITGTGAADALVISDVVPAELEYQAGTLRIDGVLEDDDFAPIGTDNSGFDATTSSVTVDQGTVAGGSAPIVITFDATIR